MATPRVSDRPGKGSRRLTEPSTWLGQETIWFQPAGIWGRQLRTPLFTRLAASVLFELHDPFLVAVVVVVRHGIATVGRSGQGAGVRGAARQLQCGGRVNVCEHSVGSVDVVLRDVFPNLVESASASGLKVTLSEIRSQRE